PLRSLNGRGDDFLREMTRIFGTNPRGSEHDLEVLARRALAVGKLPKLMVDCGRDDFLFEDNRLFHDALHAAKVPHSYSEHEGTHSWDYWDLHIQEALAFHARNLGLAGR